MKLFIYEYFSSGAIQDQDNLKRAGFAMLNAVLQDFTEIPELQIVTMLDYSLKEKIALASYRPKVHVSWHESSNHQGSDKEAIDQFQENIMHCDAVLIIAPETNGLLAKFTAVAEGCGKMVLGSSSSTLACVCNKANTHFLLASKGFPVPKSEVFSGPWRLDPKTKILERFSLPVIIKPLYGTGGEGVRLIKTQEQLDKILQQLAVLKEDTFLVQEFVPGQAVSVSCFVLNGRGFPLSLNRQIIKTGDELLIQGITVPYVDQREQDILNIVLAACEQINGLKGFVGIDLVIHASGPVLIEINARITMAYVALRETVHRNLAKDLWSLCRKHDFPSKLEFSRTYTYML